MKTYFYVGLSVNGLHLKALYQEAKNKNHLNKKIKWERFNDEKSAKKRYREIQIKTGERTNCSEMSVFGL